MAETTYTYTKAVNSDRLKQEIQTNAGITIALAGINTEGTSTHVVMRDALPSGQETILAGIVDAHIDEPLPDNTVVMTKIAEEPLYATSIDRTYQLQSYELNVPATSGAYNINISFPFAIILLGGDFAVCAENVGDKCKFIVAPNTLIGAITQPVTTGATQITVSDTVTENIWRGYNIKLMVGETITSLGFVTDITGNVLTVSQAAPSDFSPLSPTYVLTEFEAIPNFYFSTCPRLVEVGKNTFNGTYIPANAVMRFTYYNDTATAKKISFSIEYYF